LQVLGRIPAAEDADAIVYDAASNRVFTFNGDAHSSTVVDPGPGRLVTNVPLGGKPESGVAAGNGKLYVNIVDNGEVVEIDGKSLTVTRRWSTAPCQQPVAMAIDTTHHVCSAAVAAACWPSPTTRPVASSRPRRSAPAWTAPRSILPRATCSRRTRMAR